MTSVLGWTHPTIGLLWSVVFPFIYYVLPVYVKGQTLGKMIMKIRVVHLDPDQEVTLKSALIREVIGKFVSAICLMIGYLRVFTHPDHQAWHDKWSSTRVVTVKEE